ncbi:olfactory receptor 52E4-like [Protopterus annectens]|uniref:olfactory receptor 52E4-like n=1 Tax=Protopterus annectens TaxID=7888 RepID=UPI001CFB3F9D|nr:olfactory receptor 52E4-like [Protopterus annectens]
MSNTNSTNGYSTQPVIFILNGFPSSQKYKYLLFVPFFIIYVAVCFGNLSIIFVIKAERALHSPMYFCICSLALVDISIVTTFMPRMLLIFLLDIREISFSECLAQLFFVHFFAALETAVLLTMSIDRYVAICNPLRYSAIMTNTTLALMLTFGILRSFVAVGIIVFLASRLSYCTNNIIVHCYCEHMAVVQLSCGNFALNSIMGLVIGFSILIFDLVCICTSYFRVVLSLVKVTSKEARMKAFNTCSGHIIVILLSYLSAATSYIIYRVGKSLPQDVHVAVSIMYISIPAMANPVVYGVRTKEIRQSIIQMFRRVWFSNSRALP